MSNPADPVIQECAACGALIDVSDEEPLARMHCPTCGAAMRVRSRFGKFELLEILGAGGMGAVYRALDTTLNRAVALKLLRREYSEHPEFLRQFDHEAALTALINHPNVVKVYSTGSDHGVYYIAMELVDSGSLDDLMTLHKTVREPQALEVGAQIAQGLRAAFQRGLMHRDVKPGNILFADAHHAKIVDFGLAAPLDKTGQVGGEVWGTPYYVAPEKLEHPPLEDIRSDIYSLGATLFHAIAGRPPYDAQDASMVALRHLKSQPVSLQSFAPWVSSSTAFVINRMLQKDPADRYATYDELIEHLEYARNELLTKPVASVNKSASRARVIIEERRQQTALSLITLTILAVLIGGGWLIYAQRARLFPPPEKTRPASAESAQKAAAEVQPRYEDARKKLLAGNDEEAVAEFRALSEMPQVSQPLLDWITLHCGLAGILAGKLDEARADFHKLGQYGAFSSDPFEVEFSSFMSQIARRMEDDGPIPPAEADEFNGQNYEAIALLLYGLKDWELGEFEDARTLFHKFNLASPETPDDWIAEYTALPARFEDAYARFQKFAEQVKAVGDPEKAKARLPRLKEDFDKLKLTGAVQRKGRSLLRKMQQSIDDFDTEQRNALAEMQSNDDRAVAETRTKADALSNAFKFKEAVNEAKALQVISEKGKAEKKNLIKRYDWLVTFKTQLTHDLGTYPYPGGVVRRSGGLVPGQVNDADDASLIVKLPNGNLSVAWTDVSFDALVNMARSYLRTDLPPDRLADKLWTLGVLHDFFGRSREAGPYFTQAVKNKPQYAEDWSLFPNVPHS